MEKLTVTLLYGGRSGEHEVSRRSAAWFVQNMDRSRYGLQLVGITGGGLWYLQPENTVAGPEGLPLLEEESRIVSVVPGRGLASGGSLLETGLVIPVLHGTFGEDGTVQGLLEMADLPYAGADVPGCALSIDKELIKRIWEQAGLPVVPFYTLRKGDWTGDLSADQKKALSDLGLPLFVKPVHTGSSLGVSRAETLEEAAGKIREAFRYDTKIIIEPAVKAREIECSVMGNHTAESFPPGEIVSSHTFYDYDAKYTDPDGASLLIPAPLPEETVLEIRKIAREAYLTAGLTGMARVDFFVEADTGEIFLNELNAIPGFTSISMFPRMCANGGLAAAGLIDRLIALGLERYQEKRKLQFTR